MKLAVTMAVRTTAPIFADDSIAPCRQRPHLVRARE